MNSRERVRLILNHREADRPAIDLGSTRMTGTSAWTYRALKRALGVEGERVRVFDLYQMLAEVEPEVLDAIGGDFVLLPTDTLALGLRYGQWKPFTFWDGQTFDVPADFAPARTADGGLDVNDATPGGVTMRMPAGGRFFDRRPGSDASVDIPQKPESEWRFPEPFTHEYLDRERARAKQLYESTDRALIASPWGLGAPQGYANLYGWSLKMLADREHCRDYLLRLGEAQAARYEQYMEAVGEFIDVINISGADYGMQTGEFFRPELFRDLYTPAWRLVTDVIHRCEGVKVWMHCCGSVPRMIPYFIDAGVDILNPVQWTAAGMDLRTLKAEYGDRLVFWGGAISTQRTFPFGTPDDVAREAREVLDIMAPGGGYVVNPIHNILADVPVGNIVALYRTAQAYRYGRRAS